MFLVECQNPRCGGQGFTETCQPGDLDDAARCTTAAGDPEGSTGGSCSTLGHTHEEHVAHVRKTMDASARPVKITVVPGSTRLAVSGGGGAGEPSLADALRVLQGADIDDLLTQLGGAR